MAEELEELKRRIDEMSGKHFPDQAVVFGEGAESPCLVLIGEAPGAEEEKLGHPFVGKAGKNLDGFLQAIAIKREEIYITNLVKIRPTKLSEKTQKPVNRPPGKIEIALFVPFLFEEMNVIKPKLIVTLGNYPLKAILQNEKASIGEYHGKLVQSGAYHIFPLYHPASIIYNQALKTVYDEDLQRLKIAYDKLNA